MTGRIVPRGENTWQIRLDFGRDETGRRIQTTETVKGGIRTAQRRLNELLAQHKDGTVSAPGQQTVAQYMESWLKHAANQVSPRTLQGYADMVRVHIAPKLGTIRLAKLTPLHLQEYERKLLESGRVDGKGGLSPQTVLHHHRLLHTALDQAVKWRLLERNPTDGVKPPKVERDDPPVLDGEGVGTLLKLAEGKPIYVPLLVAITTGLRRGEVLALSWSGIFPERRRIEIRRSLEQTREGLRFKPPKSRKSKRNVTMPPLLVEALRVHRAEQVERQRQLGPAYEDQDLVFPDATGQPWVPGVFSKTYSNLRQRAGITVTFHGLRHTHASEMLSRGVHLKVMADRLGHASIKTTGDLYSHVTQALDAEAADFSETALREAMEDRMEDKRAA